MKYRTDFVTNSSSSSFVCYGVTKDQISMPDKEALKIFNKILNNKKETLKEYKLKDNTNDRYNSVIKKYEASIFEMESMNEAQRIEYGLGEPWHFYEKGIIEVGGEDLDEVGIAVSTLEILFPDLRMKDIRSLVAKNLNKEFGTNFDSLDIKYFESGWYNG